MNSKSVCWPFIPHENRTFGKNARQHSGIRQNRRCARNESKTIWSTILTSRNCLGWMSKRFCQRVGRKKYLVVKEQVGRRILSLSNTRNILTCHLLCFSGFLSMEFLATSSDMKQLFNSWSQKKVLCNPHCSYSVIQLAPSDILSHFHCLRLFLCFLNVQADQREPEFWGASRNLGSAIKTASNHLLVSL